VAGAAAEPLRVVLADGKPQALPADEGTAFRVRALGKAGAAPAAGEVLLALEVSPEPRLCWRKSVAVTVTKATDDRGQALSQAEPAEAAAPPRAAGPGAGGFGVGAGGPARPAPRVATARLKKGEKDATSLKEVSGTVTVEVLKEPEANLTLDDVLNAAGKSARGEDGGTLRVIDVTEGQGGEVTVRLTIDPPAGAPPGPKLSMASTRAGRMVLTTVDRSGPEHELALVDGKGAVVPVAGIGVKVRGGAEYSLTCRPQKGQGAPAKLAYTISKPATIDVPFTLKNVPLP
jgi:hypothetical protein